MQTALDLIRLAARDRRAEGNTMAANELLGVAVAVENLLKASKQAQEALEHSRPIMEHYPEPRQRHTDAFRAIGEALSGMDRPS